MIPGNESESAGDADNEEERKELKLQHDPGDGAHLADGCYFSGPTWFYAHFVADEIVQDPGADQDYRVPRYHQNREPRRKSAVLGIDLAPVADAQSNNAA